MLKKEEFIIQGKARLKGTIKIDGAKNSALKLLSACLLTDQTVILNNIPQVSDIYSMLELLGHLGSIIQFKNNAVKIITPNIKSAIAPYEIATKMRASIGVLGPLLARHQEVFVARPGGCTIGSRPVDIHLSALKNMGAEIILENGYIHAKSKGRLNGAVIDFHFPSMGATENIMMAATLAKGTTVINNAAREPEIVDLANFLNSMGAQICGQGTSTIEIQGVDKLHNTEYKTIPDRLETATYAIAALMTEGEIILTGTSKEYLFPLTDYFKDMKLEDLASGIKVSGTISNFTNITTAPHPGYPTDVQPQAMAALTQAGGMSIINEALFENRFMHVPELIRMGANIEINGKAAHVYGKTPLYGTSVMATDLRGGAALVMAALIAEDETRISNIEYIDRGYSNLEEKLQKCGVNIQRVSKKDTNQQVSFIG